MDEYPFGDLKKEKNIDSMRFIPFYWIIKLRINDEINKGLLRNKWFIVRYDGMDMRYILLSITSHNYNQSPEENRASMKLMGQIKWKIVVNHFTFDYFCLRKSWWLSGLYVLMQYFRLSGLMLNLLHTLTHCSEVNLALSAYPFRYRITNKI